MTVTALESGGKKREITDIVTLKIGRELYVPADTLILTALMDKALPELLEISAEENGRLLFDGTLDEQTAELSEKGALLHISARSKAAALLDNEAVPRSMARPLFSDVFRECARPFGITRYTGSNLRHRGEFKIEKGMSAWEALEAFCLINHRLFPRVDEHGVFSVSPVLGKRHHRFGEDGAAYLSAKRIIVRHKPISEIVTRENGTEIYSVRYTHALASYKGIVRRRIKNYAETSAAAKKQYAERDMRDAFAGSRVLKLKLLGWYDCDPGDGAKLYDSLVGNSADDVIVRVRYIWSGDGTFTELELWPRADLRTA